MFADKSKFGDHSLNGFGVYLTFFSEVTSVPSGTINSGANIKHDRVLSFFIALRAYHWYCMDY